MRPCFFAAGNEEWLAHDAALQAVLGHEPTREQVAASLAWDNCTNHAVDLFAPQVETAVSVADAAITSCGLEMVRYMAALGIQYPESVREATLPQLTARVMAIRAARQLMNSKSR